jgi:ABC-type phosphate/phosphonate transport system substrate-binding protein
VAAPIPSPSRYEGRPLYFTDIVVRAGSAHRTLEDTFGGTVGYTLGDSMSGYVALRRHLLQFRASQKPLYRKAIGGLLNPRQVIEALAAGKVDVGPLDSYYHDLLRRNDAAFAAQVRVVATTSAAPIPPLVATAPVSPAEIERLRAALRQSGAAPELRQQRETLLLRGFAVPAAADYDELDRALAAARQHPNLW